MNRSNSMRHFLFATAGSLGDLHPYIAVARALVERGHRAVIATAEDYRADVEGAGIEFAPVRPSLSEMGDYAALLTKLFDVRRGPEYLVRELIMSNLRPNYEDLTRASESADLLISHPLAVTLPLVAQRRALPWVATVLTPMSFMSSYDPPLFGMIPWLRKLRALGPQPYRLVFNMFKRIVQGWEAPLRQLRKELGLEPSTRLALFEGQFSPLCNLALFDPHLAEAQPDWPGQVRVCGAPVFDGAMPGGGIDSELEQFLAEGEAPIVFALGSSAVWVAGDFWDKAVAAAQRLGRRAILVTGPATIKGLPREMRALSYVPYSRVFPRAAAVVHQAGIGTLAQAMRAGRPQLLVPVSFDQPDNARRASALGLARAVPFKKVTPRVLATELAALLAQPEYAQDAREIAAALARIDGAAQAAEELIRCIHSEGAAAQRHAAAVRQPAAIQLT
jgi:rhamnosyltransferase subunit B